MKLPGDPETNGSDPQGGGEEDEGGTKVGAGKK
jgi:hypothetical protein